MKTHARRLSMALLVLVALVVGACSSGLETPPSSRPATGKPSSGKGDVTVVYTGHRRGYGPGWGAGFGGSWRGVRPSPPLYRPPPTVVHYN